MVVVEQVVLLMRLLPIAVLVLPLLVVHPLDQKEMVAELVVLAVIQDIILAAVAVAALVDITAVVVKVDQEIHLEPLLKVVEELAEAVAAEAVKALVAYKTMVVAE